MEKKNVSLMTEFVLTGLTDHQGLQVPLFLVFLVIYLITIVGNLGLIVLIWNDPHLHTPMYLFLGICIRLLVLSFVGGFLHSLIHKGILLRLTFCNSNIIHHFYCDIIPLFKISCTDPSINFLMVFILSGSIQVFTIVVVLVSYTLVVFTILKKNSLKGLRKAFSTCGAHLLSASFYYSPFSSCIWSRYDGSLFYMVLIPVLNPIIYSLRNKQVIDSLTKVLKRNI
uniref:G-protein coupled receptors family 1 profile domain-containing protein n=1 Tax=Cavia porcellus TaxID=10141 RepID=H0VJ75_CAVPO